MVTHSVGRAARDFRSSCPEALKKARNEHWPLSRVVFQDGICNLPGPRWCRYSSVSFASYQLASSSLLRIDAFTCVSFNGRSTHKPDRDLSLLWSLWLLFPLPSRDVFIISHVSIIYLHVFLQIKSAEFYEGSLLTNSAANSLLTTVVVLVK